VRELRFEIGCGALALAALAVRAAYVVAQPAVDPTFSSPMLDGAYYLDWARSLAGESAGPAAGAAYYLAPLYPWVLAGLIELSGDRVALVYLAQHAGTVVSSLLLAASARKLAGDWAGLATCALALGYHPTAFFASSPLGEWLGLLLLAGAVRLVLQDGVGPAAGAGALLGLASLARPNLGAVLAAWMLVETAGRRPVRALALAALGAAAILPVTARNWVASGHVVPISANMGMTLYHGNGPGATGTGMLPPGLSGRVDTQREEAARLASWLEGRPLDPVQADRYWGGEALSTRLDDPLGTLRLLFRRARWTLSNRELGLDYAPAIDDNPWRRLMPVPFALLAGLAGASLATAGWRRSGGGHVWLALVACAAAPVVFYVASRYRLPLAFLLSLPAGIGLAAFGGPAPRQQKWLGLGILAVSITASVASDAGGERRAEITGSALANRGVTWKQAGDLEAAERDLARAIEIDPDSPAAWFGLGVLEEQRGRPAEAAQAYERVLAARPGAVVPACNLARLRILEGRFDDALSLARRALDYMPDDATCWSQVVTASYLGQGPTAGRAALGRAHAVGVVLPEPLVDALERLARAPAHDAGAGP
jgi:tetratricopeptide (TPR) repeat protein